MKIKINKIDILSFLLVFLCYLIRFCQVLFGLSSFYFTLYICLLGYITFLSFGRKKFFINQFKNIFLMGILILVLTLTTKKIDFIVPLLFAFLFCDKDYKKVLLYIFLSSTILFYGSILLNYLGITENNYIHRLVDGVIIARSSLGYPNVNSAFIHFFSIPLLYYILFDKKINYLLFIFTSFYIYLETNCRTGFFCLVLFFIFIFLLPQKVKDNISKNVPLFFLIFFILSLYCGIYYYKFHWINNLTSNRLYSWGMAIKTYGVSFLGFGKSSMNIAVDNLYIGLLTKFGIISLIVYFFIYFINIKYIYDKKAKIVLLFFLIYGLFEMNFDFYINFSLFLLFYFYFNKNNFVNIKKEI